jgi:hypothetical protein
MRMSYDDLLEMESEFDQRGSLDAVNVHMLGIADKFKQSARGRLPSSHREFSREQYALLILNRRLRATCPVF